MRTLTSAPLHIKGRSSQMKTLVAGVVHVECPSCGESMPATVTCEILGDTDGEDQTLACTPDMTDIWAHVWSHDD